MAGPENPLDGTDRREHVGLVSLEMPADPWANRATFVCRTCMFFNPSRPVSGFKPEELIGRCRRHAPTSNGYPPVYPNEWCGDHKMPKGAP
jgi:hypothetical protein